MGSSCRIHGSPPLPTLCPEDGFLGIAVAAEELHINGSPMCRHRHHWHNCPELHKAIDGVRFIADHTKREEDSTRKRHSSFPARFAKNTLLKRLQALRCQSNR
uniref:Uncharacterized protein n=1 Tax=Timema monikensis TaxID=170555 RepID=A0A7R9E914_9NEOP|nr:unnamed protein product [Timema monikensis]